MVFCGETYAVLRLVLVSPVVTGGAAGVLELFARFGVVWPMSCFGCWSRPDFGCEGLRMTLLGVVPEGDQIWVREIFGVVHEGFPVRVAFGRLRRPAFSVRLIFC